MKSQQIKEKIKKLPDTPGVYFFKSNKDILYIGKATSLRDRVRSYFSGNVMAIRGPLVAQMLEDFNNIKFQKTDSVLEALILEAKLIRQHLPTANILGKDDKSFNYVVITDEEFPRVLVMRGKELQQLNEDNSPPLAALGPSLKLREGKGRVRVAKTFGPFINGRQLKEAMKIVRRMFPWRGEKCEPGQLRPCFERQIGLCPGVCTGEISQKEYKKQIRNTALFFEGGKEKLIKKLEKEMKAFAKTREFEKAEKAKRQIFALRHIQDVSLVKEENKYALPKAKFRIESYDVAHLSGTNMVGVMTVVENSEVKKSDYRKFKIRSTGAKPGQAGVGDTKALSEIISRRLAHIEWPEPDLIVVDGGKQQLNAMEKVLRENMRNIPIVAVVKDERHRPKEIIGNKESRQFKIKFEREILISNAEAHRFAIGFHKHLRRKIV